jgi:hypothetical protein
MTLRFPALATVLAVTALAPATAVASGPAAPVVSSSLSAGNLDNTGTVDFSFSADPGDTFQCALDSAPLTPCTTPFELDGLSEGPHTLTVVAVDADEDQSTPVVVNWTEDFTAPAPPAIADPHGHLTADPDATLSFSGETGGSFQCSFDGDTFAACASPVSFPGLSDGPHELQVTQTDDAGNTSDIASYDFTVDTTAPAAPALSASVGALTAETSATFTFAGEPGGSFQCSLNGAAFAACASPVTYSGLTSGAYEFVVQQVDGAGNVGDQAIDDWQVDTSLAPPPPPPTVTPAVAGPGDPVAAPPATSTTTPPAAFKPTVCASRRKVVVHWRLPNGVHAGRPQILINGKLVATFSTSTRAAAINLTGAPKGVIRVVIRARSHAGVLLQTHRSFATCASSSDSSAPTTLVLRATR